jgi:hypothetical protein
MGLKLEKGLELFIPKKKKSCVFLHYFFTSDTQWTSIALYFVSPTTEKLLNLVNEREIYWQVFADKYVLDDK